MPLIVEDGTGKADANAYIPISFADTYFAERARSGWTGDDAAKEAAIINATDYIDLRFGTRFAGVKEFTSDPAQALQFPRLVDSVTTGIPVALQRATAEYALRALTAELLPDPSSASTGGAVIKRRSKVGPLEEEVQYSADTVSTVWLRAYPFADMLLRSLFDPLFNTGRVIRN